MSKTKQIKQKLTEEEVAEKIDAEFVLYQSLDDLKKACQDAAICIE